jgi:hypothetical protein
VWRGSDLVLVIALLTAMVGCKRGQGLSASSNDKTVEVSGTIKEDDPTEFTQADESVQIGGVNLARASGYLVQVYVIQGNSGHERLIYSEEFATNKFQFNVRIGANSYSRLKITSVSGDKQFGVALPPPLRDRTGDDAVRLIADGPSTIAAKLLEIVAKEARSGDPASLSALNQMKISIADLVVSAKSVHSAVVQMKDRPDIPVSAIDLVALAKNLVTASATKIAALESDGISQQVTSTAVIDATYETMYGDKAESILPAVLAHWTSPDLGSVESAAIDVAYEALMAAASESFDPVKVAFQTEADALRTADSVESAVIAEDLLSSVYAQAYEDCVTDLASCATETYTPPAIGGAAADLNVTQVSSSASDGTYAVGNVIPVTVTFSDVVMVTGSPILILETGNQDAAASYTNGSGTAALTFNYTVVSGHGSLDLDYVSRAALTLNSGTIKGASGKTATLTLPTPGGAQSLSGSKSLVIDTVAPTAGAFSAATNVTATGFTLNWAAATDDVTAAASLQYYVCEGGSLAEIDTITECQNATQRLNWTTNQTSLVQTGLTQGSQYFYNVMVRDGANQVSLYSGKVQATASSSAEANYLVLYDTTSGSASYAVGDPASVGEWTSNVSPILSAGAGYTLKGASIAADANNFVWFTIGTINESTNQLVHKMSKLDVSNPALFSDTAVGDSISSSGLVSGAGNALTSPATVVLDGATTRVVSLGTAFSDASPDSAQILSRVWSEGSPGSWSTQQSTGLISAVTSGEPPPRALSAFKDGSSTVHSFFVRPDGSGYLQPEYYKFDPDGNTWSAAAEGAATKLGSDTTKTCTDVSFLAATTDAVAGDGRPHVVYYCQVVEATPITEIVYAYHNGTAWVYEAVTSSISVQAPVLAHDTKFGFAVHNGIGYVAYWNGSGDLQYKKRQSGAWSAATTVAANGAGQAIHTPQVGVKSNGKLRIFYIQDRVADTPQLKVYYETTGAPVTNTVYSTSGSSNSVFLGHGIIVD